LKALAQDSRVCLYREEDFGGLAKDFIDLADLAFVLEINAGIEVRNFLRECPSTH